MPSPPPPPSRRRFLQGIPAVALAAGACRAPQRARPPRAEEPEELDPLGEHGIDAGTRAALRERGQPRAYGRETPRASLPVGGIGAGELTVRSDGRFDTWAIFGQSGDAGRVEHHFSLELVDGEHRAQWTLDGDRFPEHRARLRTPMASIDYGTATVAPAPDPLGVDVALEVFSPFIPLDLEASSLPVSVMIFRLSAPETNPRAVELTLHGRLRNVVGVHADAPITRSDRHPQFHDDVQRCFRSTRLVGVSLERRPDDEAPREPDRAPRRLAGFSRRDFDGWVAEGEAFDKVSAARTNEPAHEHGIWFANSRKPRGVEATGTLRSPPFVIDRRYLGFWVAGAGDLRRAAVRLWVDGRLAHEVSGGHRREAGRTGFDLRDDQGRVGVVEIVDAAGQNPFSALRAGGFELTDQRPLPPAPRGQLGLSVLELEGLHTEAADGRRDDGSELARVSAGARLEPGQSLEIPFLLSWYFPALRRGDTGEEVGRDYGRRFSGAQDVAEAVAADFARLRDTTREFVRRFYDDSSLPHWLLERVAAPLSTLASGTFELWRDGRPWAWEGVGCCAGTCTHVWNYAQGVAQLFPELERRVRERQDLGEGFDPASGRVAMRGLDQIAIDGQLGTVLKVLREHRQSADDAFLRRVWPRTRKALEFVLQRDPKAEGVLRGAQHCTWDRELHGLNPFVGSLYLAALQAAVHLATAVGDEPFAEECRRRLASGRSRVEDELFDDGLGYFVQAPGHDEPFQVGRGCLSDQVFGLAWLRLLGEELPVEPALVRAALRRIVRHNWSPRPRDRHRRFPPFRDFTGAQGGGLFNAHWPEGERPQEPILYRDEVWTGVEYQVAAHLAAEGMVDECLVLVDAVHRRYDGRELDPFDEQECGDHYARALSSYGVYLNLLGLRVDGPRARMSLDPRLPGPLRAFFCAPEGWGSCTLRLEEDHQELGLELAHGTLRLRQFGLREPGGELVWIDLEPELQLEAGQSTTLRLPLPSGSPPSSSS